MDGGRCKNRWGFAGIFVFILVTLATGTGAMKGQEPYLHMLRFALVSASGLMVFLLLPRTSFNPSRWIMLMAVLARLAMLPMEHTDDMNRYLWEGRLITEGINPYLHAPDDPNLATLAQTDPYHSAINLPHLSAAYPPFVLGLFAAAGSVWYSPWVIKLMVVAFDLSSIWLILLLLRHRRLDARWALLYALNPVVLYAFAGEAHFDAIQNFFLLAALVAFDRRRWGWMFLLAGLAIQSKYVALVACPFLLRRDNLKWMWTGAVAVVLPFLPILAMEPGNVFSCLSTFSQHYAYNGSMHILLWNLLDDQVLAARLCMMALTTGLIVVFFLYSPMLRRRFRDDPHTGMMVAVSLLLVFSPTIHFWYLSWIAILLPLIPLRSWMLICVTISASFVTRQIYEQTGHWMLPNAFLIIEWSPLLILGWEAAAGLRRSFLPEPIPPESISVIIPTLNESEQIGPCIQAIQSCGIVTEILVADGGSQDDTAQQASAAGATVLEAVEGKRGGQIMAGIQQAAGDVVAIVHADTLVPANLFEDMLEVLRRNPSMGGGALGSVFDGRGTCLRLVQLLNDFRAAFLGIAFGDQVQFFRRETGLKHNVFCGIPLMEDVELSLRLGRIGRRAFLFGDVQVSSRKWNAGGLKRIILVLRLVGTYCFQRLWCRADTAAMYRHYYKEASE